MENLLIWSKSQMDKFTLQKTTVLIADMYDELMELYAAVANPKQMTILNGMSNPVAIKTDENRLKNHFAKPDCQCD